MSTNVSAVTKHFPKPQPGFTTTTSGSVSSGATTVGLNSTGSYSDGDVVALVIDPADSDKKQVFVGTIDTGGVQVTGVVWTDGTNQSHASGATVVDLVTATHIQMITKGILVEHNDDGTHDETLITSRTQDTAPADGDFVLTSDVSAGNALKRVTRTNFFRDAPVGNSYKFRAYRSAALTLVAATATKMALDTESYDTNNNFASGTYTVPVDGFYHFDAFFEATTTRVFASIYKNGASAARGVDQTAGANEIMGSAVSCDLQCSAGDTIEFWYFSGGAVGVSVGSDLCYFSGHLISRT